MRNLFLAIFCLLSYLHVNAQKFSSGAVLGINAAQINGDDLAGYDKRGISGGFFVAYPLGEKSDLAVEFLYNHIGSKGRVSGTNWDLNLQYAQIPVLFKVKDWFIEGKNYYKVGLDAGLSYGRIIKAEGSLKQLPNGEESLNQHDISYILSAKYQWTKRIGMSLRYTRSLNKLYDIPAENFIDLKSYFITFRSEFYF